MKKTIILLGFIAILSSCNDSSTAELEAENMELKATIEILKGEAKKAQIMAEQAMTFAKVAQERAEEQAKTAQEDTQKTKK